MITEISTEMVGWTLFVAMCCLFVRLYYTLYTYIVLLFRQWYYLRGLSYLPPHWILGHLHVFLKDKDYHCMRSTGISLAGESSASNTIASTIKMELTESHILHSIDQLIQNKVMLNVGWIGPFMALVGCFRPETIKLVLKGWKPDRLSSMIVPWIGTGLLVANGDKWLHSRRLLTPAFHVAVLKPYVQVYNKCAQTLIDKWTRATSPNASVEICESISLLTLDVILRCAFSYHSNCQDSKYQSSYIKSVYTLSRILTNRLLYFPHQIDLLFYLSSSGREFRKACKIVHDHSEKVIRDRKTVLEKQIKAGETQAVKRNMDFLDILLTTKDDDGSRLSDEEIRAEVDTFMFAGHDTTAAGIFWSLYCLAKHPFHQEKCRAEIQTVLNGRESFEWEDMKSLAYTTMCIKEAMRLYPPVPHYFRELSEDTIINGSLIPKGTCMVIGALELHRQPDIWENPKVYDPLRFLPERSEGRDGFAYMPFSAGPRKCIGQNFALNEGRVVIGRILSKFLLRLDDSHTVEMVPEVILRAKYGIKLYLDPIK